MTWQILIVSHSQGSIIFLQSLSKIHKLLSIYLNVVQSIVQRCTKIHNKAPFRESFFQSLLGNQLMKLYAFLLQKSAF